MRRLFPVTDDPSLHHGGAMLVVTRAATPTPSPRQSDGRRTHCGRVQRSPPPHRKLAADRWQRRPWRQAPREVGGGGAAAVPSCGTLRGGEGGECVRGGAGGGGGACPTRKFATVSRVLRANIPGPRSPETCPEGSLTGLGIPGHQVYWGHATRYISGLRFVHTSPRWKHDWLRATCSIS